MTKFFYNFRKPYVWPINSIFGAKKFFQKISLVHAQLLKCFYHHVKLQKKLMVQFQGQTEGQTDPFLKDPSHQCRGSKNFILKRVLNTGPILEEKCVQLSDTAA